MSRQGGISVRERQSYQHPGLYRLGLRLINNIR